MLLPLFSEKITNYQYIVENHIIYQSKAFIYVQSSPVTRSRLAQHEAIWNMFGKERQFFERIETCTGDIVQPDSTAYLPLLKTHCGYERERMICRYHSALTHFATHPDGPDWLIMSDDDTLIRPDNMYTYLIELEKFVNPKKHIVFKAYANREIRNIPYTHGGSGWLMSRAFIEFILQNDETMITYFPYSRYYQTDTSMSIVLRGIFDSDKWDERGFLGDLDRKIVNLSSCPTNETYQFNRILTMHTRGMDQILVKLFNESIDAADDIVFYNDPAHQTSHLCLGKANENPLRDRTPLIESKDINLPLFHEGDLVQEHYITDKTILPQSYNRDKIRGPFAPASNNSAQQ